MNRLEINLASNPFRSNIMYYAFHGVVASLFIVMTVFNIYFYIHYRSLRGEMGRVISSSQQEMSELDRKSQKMKSTISKKNLKDISGKALFANDIILMRKFFWTDLFNKLEEVLPYSVKMQSLRPMFVENGIEVRTDGLAQDLKSFFEFEKNLQSNPKFAHIRPENYRTLEGSGLAFSLVFEYRQEGEGIGEIYDEKAAFSQGPSRALKESAGPPEGTEPPKEQEVQQESME